MADRAGDSETGEVGGQFVGGEKSADEFLEAGMVAAGKRLKNLEGQAAFSHVVKSQVDLRSADVARKYHSASMARDNFRCKRIGGEESAVISNQ
jgi:hypothetical protein